MSPFSNEIDIDRKKWNVKDGSDYPYRELMLNDILYNDTIRSFKREDIIDLLGDPDRINENHPIYTIFQKRLWKWPLHTKTMVIKLSSDNSVEWIKVHE